MFQNGLLTKDQVKSIPASTRHYWKHKRRFPYSLENLYSKDERIERYREISKALVHIVLFYQEQLSVSKIDGSTASALVNRIAPALGLKRALRLAGISRSSYYRTSSSCPSSVLKKCYKTFPQQLSYPEIQVLSSYIRQYPNWDRKAVWHQMVKDGAAYFYLGTFYHYASLLHGKASYPPSRRMKHRVGIRASRPFELLHADVTVFKTSDGTKLYIYLLVDNFSRAILSWQVASEYSFKFVKENILTAAGNYPIAHATLLTDGGVENMASPMQSLLQFPALDIHHLVAQQDVDFSNSMVEAVNKRLKYMYLYRSSLYSLEDTLLCVGDAVEDLNHKPHGSLFGFTPDAVLNGDVPVPMDISLELKNARTARISLHSRRSCGAIYKNSMGSSPCPPA
jgi:transposase InsO family protein